MEVTDNQPGEERGPEEQQVWQASPGRQQEQQMTDGPEAPHHPLEMNGNGLEDHPDSQGAAPMAEDGPQEMAPPPQQQQQQQSGGGGGGGGGGGAHGRGGYRQREPKPNKVYIGGLPENTRQEDLQNCFGKIGKVVGIELKLGYGFVEFETVKSAEEAVAKYHEGFFMGNKIRVEQSHGGGRTSKYSSDPGACFKCGQQGHWARECPNPAQAGAGGGGSTAGAGGNKKYQQHNSQASQAGSDSLIDRISHPPREYPAPAPPRDYPAYRDDYRGDRERYPPPPPRDDRYSYVRPAPPRDARDYRDTRDVRIPPSPPREYRDYGASAPRRDYEDYRRGEGRGPPPPPMPPSRYEARPYYPEPGYGPPPPPPAGYPPRADYPPPPPRDAYPRTYDRRDSGAPPPPPPPGDKYAYAGPPPPVPRMRSPGPAPPRAAREEYERAPPREYARPPAEYRGRSPPPPAGGRYPEYAPRESGGSRYGRRTPSPPRPAGGPYRGFPDPKVSGGAPAYPPAAGYSENGYSNAPSGGPGGPPVSAGRSSGMSNGRERDFAPRSAGAGEPAGYVRRG